MSVSINGTSGLVFNDATTQATAPKVGMVNRIINGAMMIDQRNAGASVSASGSYAVDRFYNYQSTASKFTVQQNASSVTPPVGFINYLGATSSSAYSITSTDQFLIVQKIEGLNVADLGWGTVNASAVTLSFWVRSSLTGTFGGAIQNSAANRNYPFSYTISVANTWEQKSITIAGDTTGTWLTTNGVGLSIVFSLGTGATYSATAGSWTGSSFITSATGATSVVGTNGATFYITGVQLEKGSTATSFDYRPYGTELNLCYRYFQKYIDPMTRGVGTGAAVGGAARMGMAFVQTMRAAPSITATGTFNFYDGSGTFTSTGGVSAYSTTNAVEIDINSGAAITVGRAVIGYVGSGTPVINASAEL
jgi:hypothetical protein